jgi:hypothetical protein
VYSAPVSTAHTVSIAADGIVKSTQRKDRHAEEQRPVHDKLDDRRPAGE